MIVYTPFWETIKEKNITTYMLINKYRISSSTINRIRHNQPINTDTINRLCEICQCGVEQIIKYQ